MKDLDSEPARCTAESLEVSSEKDGKAQEMAQEFPSRSAWNGRA